ncbi:SHOCT domain-containing protein [Pengzhenrongella sicca]|uniref:PLDc N-terminal domain-containing protein n=1 Tax=Pengzhenrongella sicca TaxID=2819238 RepID=A0A8A4ZDJ5_9MICO|nr:SHOCT domain-containing protein [Pengzhenrongella sicca]QTE28963.1 PLDc N-terminal domain-containing protein [Pengzhenrongella sicca]
MEMFSVIIDIFRNDSSSGFAKAIWVLALIFLPVITVLVYLLAKGSSMSERSVRRAYEAQARQEAYIREVATTSSTRAVDPVVQLTQAKALLDAGAISATEFESLKAKTLA